MIRGRKASLAIALLSVGAVLFALGCDQPVGPFTGPGVHVLYIGNSLTYANDLPATVAGIMTTAGREISSIAVALPDFALIDHLHGGSDALDQIKRGGWDYVILQQGPSSLPESRDLLVQGTIEFDAHIRHAGALTALCMVWPDRSRIAYFADVRDSYRLAADSVGGLFIPAGESWLDAWQSDSTLALYAFDGFHPSSLGTYLAALTIVEKLAGVDVRELPPVVEVAGRIIDVPETTARALQAAAHAACERYK